MNNFALIGVAGYIAPRHLKAIRETGNNLVACLDRYDSVGIIDSFFPEADFFTEFERFDRHIDKIRRTRQKTDYISICSPNYLHDSHIRFALRSNAHAICEKPVVLNPWNIDGLLDYEKETGKKAYTVLQLRLHPAVRALKEKIDQAPPGKTWDIQLSYITSRGNWYRFSWKGDEHKSGGISTNIGVHFFDLLTWIFGDVKENIVHISRDDKASGFLGLERARVKWFLSIDRGDLPGHIREDGQATYRSMLVDREEIEFSRGFTNLHTETYREILEGRGWELEESRRSVETVFAIRNAEPVGLKGEYHPFCRNIE